MELNHFIASNNIELKRSTNKHAICNISVSHRVANINQSAIESSAGRQNWHHNQNYFNINSSYCNNSDWNSGFVLL
jgi:hypothetical protein